MDLEQLFGSDGGNGEDLPEPNVTMPLSGDDHMWTEKDIRGILCNPIYAGIGPYPAMISDKHWIRAAANLIEEDGKEQFLVNLLYLLRMCFQNAELKL